MAETSQIMKKMSSNSILSNRSLEETQWVVEINKLIERDDLETALETPISIFTLPNSITNEKPESYFPHTLALGPYHHFNPHLYKMEIFKLEKAKEAKERFNLPSFNQIVDEQLKPLDLKIRACFNKHLDLGSETLCWTMLIDGLFLLRLLGKGRFSIKPEFPLPIFKEQKLYDGVNGNLTSQCEIVNDILKLENQIPFLVLKEILHKNDLHVLFYQSCVSISPITSFPNSYYGILSLEEVVERSHHLLHFLYLLIINQKDPTCAITLLLSTSLFWEMLNIVASVFQVDFLQQLNEIIGLIQSLFGLNKSSLEDDSPAPIIPSASELEKVKLKFNGNTFSGIRNMKFERGTLTLTLPSIKINPFAEVLFRNFIAFEAMAKIDPPCFTQYLALMSGLITTTKDVTILKKAEILHYDSNFRSDEDIVKMFHGLRKTIGSHYISLIMESSLVSEARSTSNSEAGWTSNSEMGWTSNSEAGWTSNLEAGSTSNLNLESGSTSNSEAGSKSNSETGSTSNSEAGSTYNLEAGSTSNLNSESGSASNSEARSKSNSETGLTSNSEAGSTSNLNLESGSTSNSESGSTSNSVMGWTSNSEAGWTSNLNIESGSTSNSEAGSKSNSETGSTSNSEAGSTYNLEAGSTSNLNLESGSTSNSEARSKSNSETGSTSNSEAGSTSNLNLESGSTSKSEAGSNLNLESGSTSNSEAGSKSNSEAGSTSNSETGWTSYSEAGSTSNLEAGSTLNSRPSMVNMVELIKEINEFYESCWRVKAKRFMNKYMWSALKAIFYLIMILFLLCVLVRTFCDLFSCQNSVILFSYI